MQKISIGKFAAFLLVFTIAVFVQLNLKAVFGWTPEFALAAMVISAFYASALEMAALSAFGILLINWRPSPGWEIILFFLLPFAAMYARNFFPWKNAVSGTAAAVLCTAIFYGLTNPAAAILNPAVSFYVIFLTAVFAAAFFRAFGFFYKNYSV